MTGKIIAMGFGVLGTVLLNLSKGLQRYGIDSFFGAAAPLDSKAVEVRKKKRLLYITGIILNNTIFLWMILANLHAPSSYYTSMTGLGLLVLLLFSSKVLHEEVGFPQYLGSLIIIFGTLFVGYDKIKHVSPSMSAIDVHFTSIFSLIFSILILVPACIAMYRKRLILQSVFFGILTGGLGSLDPVFKGIGQNISGVPRAVPDSFWGWVYFLVSFALGTTAFLLTQKAFSKRSKVSILVTFQIGTYILLPLLIQAAALPGYQFTPLTILGITGIIVGIGISLNRRPPQSAPETVG